MSYRGYLARIEFDPRDNIFWGKVLGITDSITFEGEAVATLEKDFHAAIDDYLEDCEARGVSPDRPASGKMMLRVPPEVHAAASLAAEAVGKSLNQWASDVLERAARPK
ncbi:MAG: type II toxin-antitoxin system HicB family antitoxin [Deinococcota bacterium]|nr:type II toxin-antitoxin system HicB family antitoxin [Deinococcota bacterium]